MVDVTQNTYPERIEKSPEFNKDIKVVFADDISTEVMKKFQEGGEDWIERMLAELIIDWNLTDKKGAKLPRTVEGLDKIKSIKLRNWIIQTLQEVLVEKLSIIKKK